MLGRGLPRTTQSVDLLDVGDVLERAQGFNDLAVFFVLLQLGAVDGQGYGIDAQPRVQVRRVGFYVLDPDPQAPDRRDEVLQVALALQLQMDLEMVRVVLHVPLDGRKQGQAGEQGQKGDRRHRVEPGAQRHPDQSAAPEGRRRGQALDLAFRAEQDGINTNHRDTTVLMVSLIKLLNCLCNSKFIFLIIQQSKLESPLQTV